MHAQEQPAGAHRANHQHRDADRRRPPARRQRALRQARQHAVSHHRRRAVAAREAVAGRQQVGVFGQRSGPSVQVLQGRVQQAVATDRQHPQPRQHGPISQQQQHRHQHAQPGQRGSIRQPGQHRKPGQHRSRQLRLQASGECQVGLIERESGTELRGQCGKDRSARRQHEQPETDARARRRIGWRRIRQRPASGPAGRRGRHGDR